MHAPEIWLATKPATRQALRQTTWQAVRQEMGNSIERRDLPSPPKRLRIRGGDAAALAKPGYRTALCRRRISRPGSRPSLSFRSSSTQLRDGQPRSRRSPADLVCMCSCASGAANRQAASSSRRPSSRCRRAASALACSRPCRSLPKAIWRNSHVEETVCRCVVFFWIPRGRTDRGGSRERRCQVPGRPRGQAELLRWRR